MRAIVEKYAQDMVHPSLEGIEQIGNNWYNVILDSEVLL